MSMCRCDNCEREFDLDFEGGIDDYAELCGKCDTEVKSYDVKISGLMLQVRYYRNICEDIADMAKKAITTARAL